MCRNPEWEQIKSYTIFFHFSQRLTFICARICIFSCPSCVSQVFPASLWYKRAPLFVQLCFTFGTTKFCQSKLKLFSVTSRYKTSTNIYSELLFSLLKSLKSEPKVKAQLGLTKTLFTKETFYRRHVCHSVFIPKSRN